MSSIDIVYQKIWNFSSENSQCWRNKDIKFSSSLWYTWFRWVKTLFDLNLSFNSIEIKRKTEKKLSREKQGKGKKKGERKGTGNIGEAREEIQDPLSFAFSAIIVFALIKSYLVSHGHTVYFVITCCFEKFSACPFRWQLVILDWNLHQHPKPKNYQWNAKWCLKSCHLWMQQYSKYRSMNNWLTIIIQRKSSQRRQR